MSGSAEDSPDWLRCFQAPGQSLPQLPRDSESSPNNSPVTVSEDEKDSILAGGESPTHRSSKMKTESESLDSDNSIPKTRKRDKHGKKDGNRKELSVTKKKTYEKPIKHQVRNHSVLTLSSDSESSRETSLLRDDNKEFSAREGDRHLKRSKDEDPVPFSPTVKSSISGISKLKSPKKRLKVENKRITKTKVNSEKIIEKDGDMDVVVEQTTKHTGSCISSSRLPLVLSDKVQRSKALVECEGESIDLSGDIGSVGRVVIADNSSGSHELLFDLKGTIYKTNIVPSRTFCIVSFGQSEAKIEAIMNDFIQLKPQSNVYEAETMVEGTMEGFSFDLEDEGENMPKDATHQTVGNEDAKQQSNGQRRGKPEKSGVLKKNGKTTARKPPKKVKKKSQAPKKTKTKK